MKSMEGETNERKKKLIQLQEKWVRELAKYIVPDKFLEVFGRGKVSSGKCGEK